MHESERNTHIKEPSTEKREKNLKSSDLLEKRERPSFERQEPLVVKEVPEIHRSSIVSSKLDNLIEEAKKRITESPPKQRHKNIFKFLADFQDDKSSEAQLVELFHKKDPFEENSASKRSLNLGSDSQSKNALYKIFEQTLNDLTTIKKFN